MDKRIAFVKILFIVGFAIVLVRLFYWQVVKSSELSVEARNQYNSGNIIKSLRGEILSSDKSWLVARSDVWKVYASIPSLDMETGKLADKLAPYFVEPIESEADEKDLLNESARLKKVLNRGGIWVLLQDRISDDTRKRIEALSLSGIEFEQEGGRIYPEASSAAHLLGFLGQDAEGNNLGYFGLEGYYDTSLSGREGYSYYEKDASGLPILLGQNRQISAIHGVNLLTGIDKTIQLRLNSKLQDGMSKYGAQEVTGIILEPRTGKILAMSSFPSYDPSKYYNFDDSLFKDPAISSSFEPGSIFKVIVMAAGLDSGVIKPDTKCDICSGKLVIGEYSVRTWNNEYRPNSTMVDVIVNSDNVGMSFVGRKLGEGRLRDYLEKFGIGQKTGIDLQGEMTPKLRDKWSEIDVATASFGQGIAVTPIQMINAVGAIANNGIIVKPHIVEKIVGDNWEEDVKTDSGERVISEKAAREVTAMMVEAAKNGEAKWTYQKGLKVAGKTGTAQIPIEGHYDEEKTIASFIGFAPYDNPRFLMLITLKEPSTSPWASETAAPLWYSMARDLYVYMGLQPED